MLTTPFGTSEASSTVYSSVAASGWASDGIATTVAELSETAAPRSDDLASVGCVGPNLLAPDEHLVGAVDPGERGAGSGTCLLLAGLRSQCLRKVPLPAPRSRLPSRLQVLPH